MARPKKISTADMLRILESYLEKNGDTDKLKCSNLEEYAATLGIRVKAYDFRRDEAVRRRIDELIKGTVNDRISALTYKNLDADAFITRHPTRATLKAALLELDSNWCRVYERSVAVAAENTALISENYSKKCAISELTDEITAAQDDIKSLRHTVSEQQGELRYMRSLLETYLYPALADELLRREGVPMQTDMVVSDETVKVMTDTDIPMPLSDSIKNDGILLSREQTLIERMKSQIKKR